LDERGDGLTASSTATARRYSSADLGRTLRSIVLSPRRGFGSAIAAADKRASDGTRPAEGSTTYVLAALGGGAAVVLWLKLGGLLGARDISATEFRWSYLIVGLIAGALLGLVVQALWAYVAAVSFRFGGREIRPRDLRLVWGASAFPQILVFLVLLPLDLLIVGSETFTTTRLTDPLATGWAAISIALAVSLAVWSVYLFARGMQVAAGSGWGASLAGAALAAASAVAVLLVVVVATRMLGAGS